MYLLCKKKDAKIFIELFRNFESHLKDPDNCTCIWTIRFQELKRQNFLIKTFFIDFHLLSQNEVVIFSE